MTRYILALILSMITLTGGLAETAVAPPKTIIDALTDNKTPGWSSITLPDSRPVALYRGSQTSPATLALSCLPTGEIVAAGGPGRFLIAPHEFDDKTEIIIPIMGNRVMWRGVFYLADSLSKTGFTAKMDQMPEPIPASPDILAPLGSFCEKLAKSHPEETDAKTYAEIVWSGKGNMIEFGTSRGDSYLPLDITCENKALKIDYQAVPKGAKNNQITSLLIAPGISPYSLKGKIEIQTDGMGLEITHAIASSPSALLADLANENTFGIGWNNSLDTVFPTQGLSYLIEKHLGECR